MVVGFSSLGGDKKSVYVKLEMKPSTLILPRQNPRLSYSFPAHSLSILPAAA